LAGTSGGGVLTGMLNANFGFELDWGSERLATGVARRGGFWTRVGMISAGA
jgi:hypothetical protein